MPSVTLPVIVRHLITYPCSFNLFLEVNIKRCCCLGRRPFMLRFFSFLHAFLNISLLFCLCSARRFPSPSNYTHAHTVSPSPSRPTHTARKTFRAPQSSREHTMQQRRRRARQAPPSHPIIPIHSSIHPSTPRRWPSGGVRRSSEERSTLGWRKNPERNPTGGKSKQRANAVMFACVCVCVRVCVWLLGVNIKRGRDITERPPQFSCLQSEHCSIA